MSQLNKIKYNIQNIKNVIQGKEQLIQFQKKYYDLKDTSILQKIQNRVQYQEGTGRLYKVKQNGQKQYLRSKEEYGVMPNWCPKCGRLMGKKVHDEKFWQIHNLCMDCGIQLEHQMKLNGIWEQYERNTILNNMQDMCRDAIVYYQQMKNQATKEFVLNTEGQIEQYSVQDKQLFFQTIDNIIEGIKKYIEYVQYYKDGTMSQQEIQEKIKQDNKNIIQKYKEMDTME